MNKRISIPAWVFVAVVVVVAIGACSSPAPQTVAQQQALQNAQNAQIYVPQNGVELRNYNWRQELSDQPSTILWCTSSFMNPSSPFITVPIIGKLTSGNKRPYPTEIIRDLDVTSVYEYYPELPGPDAMFGSSGEYRYGFGPTGQGEYYDWYQIPVFCTTQMTVWQRESTTVVLEKDDIVNQATDLAEEALRNGDGEAAEQILLDALNEGE